MNILKIRFEPARQFKGIGYKMKLRFVGNDDETNGTSYFDVLLTVHYSNDQFWFQLMHHNFILLTKSLYMFRAPTCPSSGGQTIHTPQLVKLHLKLNI